MRHERCAEQFLVQLRHAIDQRDAGQWRAAWGSQTARTRFYGALLTRVAGALDLKLEQELLLVDFVMVGTRDRVPRIFLESENIATSSIQEIRKLCCLSAPVKALLTVCPWDDAPGVWNGKGQRRVLTAAWSLEVAAHRAAGTLVGVIIAIIAEWRPDNRLCFHALRFDAPQPAETLLSDREMGPSPAAAGGAPETDEQRGERSMIYTGTCVVSASARRVLAAAAETARRRGAAFADCSDLLDALRRCQDGQVAGVWPLLGPVPWAASSGIGDELGASALPPSPNVIQANRPLQQVIELAADGPAITTGSLLLGLVRAPCGLPAKWIREAHLTEAGVQDALTRCAPDAMPPDDDIRCGMIRVARHDSTPRAPTLQAGAGRLAK